MKTILISIFSLFIISCQSNSVKDKIENDEMFNISPDDEEMNMAIEKSKITFGEFITAYHNPLPEDEYHAIKIGFATPDNSLEHIWVGDIFEKDGSLYGTVNNMPQSTKVVNFGDTIKIDKNKMSDWMYISKGILKGGYTLKVMRNQLSEPEKKEFDHSVGFIIED